MAIRDNIIIKNNELPDSPGVYFYFDENDEILYVGKATSLKNRVNSYFTKAHDNRIGELVTRIRRIDYIQTPTVIEALVLEANKIKVLKPPYNILMRDDKSYLYLGITNEEFPKPLMFRGLDLEKIDVDPFKSELSEKARKKFLAIYGPYTSGYQLKKALEFLRKMIPWSICEPPSVSKKSKPCFYRHIKQCPGVCSGEISKQEYRKIIKQLMLFFEGKKGRLLKSLETEMLTASKNMEFERAAVLRNNIYALTHIRDVAFITKEDVDLPFSKVRLESTIDLEGRIEAYDISNISGTSAVGSMVVFKEGRASKEDYRKFKIKTVIGANDTAMMEEVMRLRRAEISPKSWPLPEVMVIDGGKPQVNRVQKVLDELGVKVSIIGLAKGFDRKQDRMVYDRSNTNLLQVAGRGKELFQKARDESHRFAVKYHKELRSKASGIKKKK